MITTEDRINAITFDLKTAIDDFANEIKRLSKELDELKEKNTQNS